MGYGHNFESSCLLGKVTAFKPSKVLNASFDTPHKGWHEKKRLKLGYAVVQAIVPYM